MTSQHIGGVDLHIHEPPPLLRVRVEALHEPGIAIPASVLAADVAVERVVVDAAAIQQRATADLAHDRAAGGELRCSLRVTFIKQRCLSGVAFQFGLRIDVQEETLYAEVHFRAIS